MIAGILLAAGKSTRYGKNKLLQPLPDGSTVGARAARNLNAALPGSVAVVRPADHQLAEQMEASGLRVVVNPAAATGMGSSLACGVAATRGASGWLIALADMPFIQPATIRSLALQVTDELAIVVPRHAGVNGHPVGFGRGYLRQLLQLGGDQGGRSIVRANQERTVILEVPDSAVLRDIDYPGHLPR